MAAKTASLQIVRRIILGISLVGLTVVTVLHQRNPAFPSIDALDPFGGIETLMKYVAGGELIKKIMPGNIVLLGAIVVLGVVLSRFFCGWFCAFGALQGVFGWLGRKVFRRRLEVPRKLDAVLRWAKYPILAAIVYFTWRAGDLVIRPYDPLAAYGHLSAGIASVWAEFGVGLVILVAVLLLSMLYERVFCKYICPLGAVNAILSRIPLFRIKRDQATCISCSKCDRVCSMNVDVSTPRSVDSPECIACMECVTACPTKKSTLSTTLGGKAVKAGAVAAIGIGIYLAAALVGQGLGMLGFSAPSIAQQAASGNLKVEDIKGSSTWKGVADGFGIDLALLYREAGVDQAKVPPETMLKDTGKLIGVAFEADAARVAVAKIIGVPYSGEKALPAAAPAAPKAQVAEPSAPEKTAAPAAPAKAAPTPAAPAKAAPAPVAAPALPATAAQDAGALAVPADFALEGTMSVNDVVRALGASASAVIAKLGLPADMPADEPLRDLKDRYGYTMPELKERLKR
jgi:ferredoxin